MPPRPRYWIVLLGGCILTLLSALLGGCELDGIPVSMMVYGRPLWWLKIQSATRYHPTFQTTWSISFLFLAIDTLLWSSPVLVVLRLRHSLQLRRFHDRQLAGQCGRCGYDLRGTPEPRCPECGQPTQTSTPA